MTKEDIYLFIKNCLFLSFIIIGIIIVCANIVPIAVCAFIWFSVDVIDEHINQRKDNYDE